MSAKRTQKVTVSRKKKNTRENVIPTPVAIETSSASTSHHIKVKKKQIKRKRKRVHFNYDKYVWSQDCWLKQITHPAPVHLGDCGHLVYLVLCTYKKTPTIYVGKTNDIARRWQEHNGILAGGAEYTKNFVSRGFQWEPLATIAGFRSEGESLSCEKRCKVMALKYAKDTLAAGIKYAAPNNNNNNPKKILHLKVRKMLTVLNQPKIAKRWDWACNTPLQLTWYKPEFKPLIKHKQGVCVPPHVKEIDYPGSTVFQKKLKSTV